MFEFCCNDFRIRRLNWINANHLDCRIDETNADVRDLVYNSILGKAHFFSNCFGGAYCCRPLQFSATHWVFAKRSKKSVDQDFVKFLDNFRMCVKVRLFH